MKTVSDFPHQITEELDMGIVLPDGTRLSARTWMPVDAGDDPVPVILEYLPYRKTDGTAARDAISQPYLAGHGFACVRVDIRGCGESEGLYDDEYSQQELQDGVDVINWLAEQPWCNGNVGMMGISWGGFNGLQIAALNPAPLKAIITICSTVDRYADDIHYKGGIQVTENIGWAATSMSWFSLPPDPALVGDSWRDTWLNRLENTPFLAKTWTGHKDRDSYWKHGSVCEDYSAIKAAVLSIGGWHDGYRNTISHLVENLSSPVKGVVGPWNHKYPHIASPGPKMGYLQEAVRWFGQWLRGEDNGVERDPAYRAYLMDSIAPKTRFDHRPGRWIAEEAWPAPAIESEHFPLSGFGLGDGGAEQFERHYGTALECGLKCGEYFPFGFGPGELPDDQRQDDALSLCFDSPVLEKARDIVGAPKVALKLSCDQPRAQLAVRLCDLRPDGSSAFITYGFLNLRHRNSFEFPEDLEPGETYEVDVILDQVAYRLPAGHRLRVAVSSSYWPFIWPEAEPVSLTVRAGGLHMPVRPAVEGAGGGDECSFPEAVGAPGWNGRVVRESAESKQIVTDAATGETRVIIESDNGATEDLNNGLVEGSYMRETWSLHKDDPASARAEIIWNRSMGRGNWQVETRTCTRMWADKMHFHFDISLKAFEAGEPVFEKNFRDSVER